MEAPLRALAGQLWAVRRSLRLLLALLVPCLLLLLLLSAMLLLRRRFWRKGGPASPPRSIPGTPQPARLPTHPRPGGPTARRQLAQPRDGAPAGPRAARFGRRAAASSLAASSPRWLRPAAGSSSGAAADLDQHPILVPPNSLVTSSDTGGVLERVFPSCHTSTQRKPRSGSRVAPGSHPSTGPFEFGSSIQPGNRRACLNSANFTASQGPGLDSDFGASAGVSVRILSTDSEGSPNTPRQQAEPFEWDYYDPSYKRKTPLHRSLPPICSKQYWL